MKTISGKELCSILEKKGWLLKRITGSHHIFVKEGKKERISVPVHKNKPLKIGLLKHIIKLVSISEEELI
ncbi:MAG: type II toxin-antitoxin system HicA family toxin [Candidatus Omnitrophota bacterium]|nr:type II toxin-antitoxin system HicA family toxin [Candidatus Omnitrophota bacterium]